MDARAKTRGDRRATFKTRKRCGVASRRVALHARPRAGNDYTPFTRARRGRKENLRDALEVVMTRATCTRPRSRKRRFLTARRWKCNRRHRRAHHRQDRKFLFAEAEQAEGYIQRGGYRRSTNAAAASPAPRAQRIAKVRVHPAKRAPTHPPPSVHS